MKIYKKILILIFLNFAATSSYAETKDCFETANRAFFSFNQGLDKIIFQPIAKGYSYLPSEVQKGVRNVTSNISNTVTIPNHFLQGNFKNFANDGGRLLINTTFGILGLFDPASKLGLKKIENEDYGQTLGFWGVGNGCYLMLPIFGPSTTRDMVGKVANTLLDPFYMTTVGDKRVLDNNFGDSTYYIEKGFDTIDSRSQNLKNFKNLEQNSIDLYASVRSLYLQRRENLISNNNRSGQKDDWEKFK
jgi:phospholipid-binding lipoprotein MlaA